MRDSEFDLAEVIECLRQQLREARIKGVGQTPRFLVDEAEVELKVGVTDEGEAGVNFKVFGVGIGANASLASEAVQTIRLKLKPEAIDPNSPTEEPEYRDVYVNDEGRDRPPVETESTTEPE